MKRNLTILLTFLFTAMVLVGCKNDEISENSNEFKPFAVGEKIKLKSVIGNEITVVRTENGFKMDGSKKIIMFDFFATYCQPCRDEAAHLMSFQLKNSDDFMIIGLITFEDIADKEVVDNFSKNYNAYYFIANSKTNPNDRIIEQVLRDISYQSALTIPFKVIYKNGIVQQVSNNEMPSSNKREFYVGKLPVSLLQSDLDRIKSAK